MSKLAQSNEDDYPEAAGRHAEDADILWQQNRHDGAAYLAGYAVECVLKTIIQVEQGPQRGHNLNDLSLKVQRLASLPSNRTGRYISKPEVTVLAYGLPTGWEEILRYRGQEAINFEAAQDCILEAWRLYREIIINLRLDGVV